MHEQTEAKLLKNLRLRDFRVICISVFDLRVNGIEYICACADEMRTLSLISLSAPLSKSRRIQSAWPLPAANVSAVFPRCVRYDADAQPSRHCHSNAMTVTFHKEQRARNHCKNNKIQEI